MTKVSSTVNIKPENVLDRAWRRVVTDFGIARALDAARIEPRGSTITQDGTALGTPAYMAPEQALAKSTSTQRGRHLRLGRARL